MLAHDSSNGTGPEARALLIPGAGPQTAPGRAAPGRWPTSGRGALSLRTPSGTEGGASVAVPDSAGSAGTAPFSACQLVSLPFLRPDARTPSCALRVCLLNGVDVIQLKFPFQTQGKRHTRGTWSQATLMEKTSGARARPLSPGPGLRARLGPAASFSSCAVSLTVPGLGLHVKFPAKVV